VAPSGGEIGATIMDEESSERIISILSNTTDAVEAHRIVISQLADKISDSLKYIAIALTEIAMAIRECDFHD
jgi:hypothetical protein